jgi:hypothetical protein
MLALLALWKSLPEVLRPAARLARALAVVESQLEVEVVLPLVGLLAPVQAAAVELQLEVQEGLR